MGVLSFLKNAVKPKKTTVKEPGFTSTTPMTQQQFSSLKQSEQKQALQRQKALQSSGVPSNIKLGSGAIDLGAEMRTRAELLSSPVLRQSVNAQGNYVLQFRGQEPMTLTPEEYKQYSTIRSFGGTTSALPNVQGALSARPMAEQAGLTPEGVFAPDIEQRNIWASTFREGLGSAISKGATGALTGALVGGKGGPIGAVGGALIGFIGTAAASLYTSYGANQKEEVNNAFKGFQGLKTGISAQLTAVRAGAISPAQAAVNIQYAEQRLSYYESLLRQKQDEGGFIADISDYDGKMAYMIEYRNLYFPAIKSQSDFALQSRGYLPEEVFIPDYEEVSQ